jgi:hypothetical protein
VGSEMCIRDRSGLGQNSGIRMDEGQSWIGAATIGLRDKLPFSFFSPQKQP